MIDRYILLYFQNPPKERWLNDSLVCRLHVALTSCRMHKSCKTQTSWIAWGAAFEQQKIHTPHQSIHMDLLLQRVCLQSISLLTQIATRQSNNDRPYERARHRISCAGMGSHLHRNNALWDSALLANRPHSFSWLWWFCHLGGLGMYLSTMAFYLNSIQLNL